MLRFLQKNVPFKTFLKQFDLGRIAILQAFRASLAWDCLAWQWLAYIAACLV